MKQIENIKTKIFNGGSEYTVGIKWDGFGIKGSGTTIDAAVADAVKNFYEWLRQENADAV